MKVQVGRKTIDVEWGFRDRITALLNPTKGAELLQKRTMSASLGGYVAGSRDRRSMRNWFATETLAIEDISPDFDPHGICVVKHSTLESARSLTNTTN